MKHRFEIVADLIRERHCKRVAEIGISAGTTVEHILKFCNNIEKYYAVDPDYTGIFPYGLFKHRPELAFIRLRSSEAVKCIGDGTLDLVYIDADHGYQSVKEDIELWTPKVKKDGIICGHDYSETLTLGVKKAVLEYFDPKLIHLEPEVDFPKINVWWVYKHW